MTGRDRVIWSQEESSSCNDIAAPSDAVSCGPLWVSPDEWCETRIAGRRVPMPATRRRILAALIKAKGSVVGRDLLYKEAGLARSGAGSRAIDIHLARLRKDLGEFGPCIVSIRGRGYRINLVRLLERRA